MNEKDILKLIRREIEADNVKAQYGVSRVPYHTHNNTDSSLIPYLQNTLGYLQVSAVTNGTTSVNVFSPFSTPANLVVTGIFLIALDATAGNITVACAGNTIATIAKGATMSALIGATSLANTTCPKGSTFTIVSSTAGNAMVFITFKLTP